MKTIGEFGEQIAVEFLKKNDYKILDRNYRFERAEIDIICKLNDLIIFVEVKTRSGTQFGNPEQAVSKTKQKHLARAAQEYLELIDYQEEIRFDIISILINRKEVSEILHLEDAFFPIS